MLYFFKGKRTHGHVQMLYSPMVPSKVHSISCHRSWICYCLSQPRGILYQGIKRIGSLDSFSPLSHQNSFQKCSLVVTKAFPHTGLNTSQTDFKYNLAGNETDDTQLCSWGTCILLHEALCSSEITQLVGVNVKQAGRRVFFLEVFFFFFF